MQTLSSLSQVQSSREIRRLIEWHLLQGVPLKLVLHDVEGLHAAHVRQFHEHPITIEVSIGTEVRQEGGPAPFRYTCFGLTTQDVRFMGSGWCSVDADQNHVLQLSLPRWLVLADLDNVPTDSEDPLWRLRFCADDPHQGDVFCRIREVSRDGFRVFWTTAVNGPPPALDSYTEPAWLMANGTSSYLGPLHVCGAVHQTEGWQLDLDGITSALSNHSSNSEKGFIWPRE